MLTKEWSFTFASKPAISGFSPANGSTIGTSSGVSAKIIDDNGIIDPATVKMAINGADLPVTWNATTSSVVYNGQLSAGSYTVQSSAADNSGNVGTATWGFTVKDNAPVVGLGNIPTVTNGVLKFETVVTDTVGLVNYSDLRLNGQPLAASFRYEGFYDTCGYYTVTDSKKGFVSYEGTVADGIHSLTLVTKNQLGNTSTKTWTLNVATPPVITENVPTTYITSLKPVISAKAIDVNTGVSRGVFIRAYKTDYSDGTGNQVGYRVEVWYK